MFISFAFLLLGQILYAIFVTYSDLKKSDGRYGFVTPLFTISGKNRFFMSEFIVILFVMPYIIFHVLYVRYMTTEVIEVTFWWAFVLSLMSICARGKFQKLLCQLILQIILTIFLCVDFDKSELVSFFN